LYSSFFIEHTFTAKKRAMGRQFLPEETALVFLGRSFPAAGEAAATPKTSSAFIIP